MSEYFETIPARPVVSAPPSPDEVARGDWWSLLKRKEGYVLEYIAGEQGGGLKQLHISVEEGERILQGEAKVEKVLLEQGVG